MVELALKQEPILNQPERGRFIEFEGVRGTVFNITAPFEYNGGTLIAGRIQASKDKSLASTIGIFRQTDDLSYTLINRLPTIGLEDPSIAHIKGDLIFSCVKTYIKANGDIGYRTLFYKNPDFDNFDPEHDAFAIGQDEMKDTRLVELQDGRIGVFPRPQKLVFTSPQRTIDIRGRIGFTILDSLEELAQAKLTETPLIDIPFKPNECGGVNAAYLLKDGRIGVLGHIASVDNKGKHYGAMVFPFDPNSGVASPIEIIASREDFPEDPTDGLHDKNYDVVFSGGLRFNDDRTTDFFGGVSDKLPGEIEDIQLPAWFKV